MTNIESGVRFEAAPDSVVEVAATFIDSGDQLQHLFIGLEPVLLVQPEYDIDENKITFNLTAVDLDPRGLLTVLEILIDTTRTMVETDLAKLEETVGAPE